MSNPAFDLIDLDLLRQNPQFTPIDGSGIGVAVIDSGIDAAHSQLQGNVRQVVDFVRPSTHPRYGQDEQGHGTHVAGTIASTNPEIGVAPDANLIALKVGGPNGGDSLSMSAIERALQWVLKNRQTYNIQVINLSLGAGLFSTANDFSLLAYPYLDEVQALIQAGVTVVAAAGNEYTGSLGSSAPGIFSTLTVGAVYDENEGAQGYTSPLTGEFVGDRSTASDRHTYFSHRPNTSNGIFAPGASITSTLPGNRVGDLKGTSMAAPHVTGVVALMQEAAFSFGGRYLKPSEVRDLLISTADPILDGDDENTTVPVTRQAYPRLNAYRAVQAVQNLFTNNLQTGRIANLVNPGTDSSLSSGMDGGTGSGTPISSTFITGKTRFGTQRRDTLVGNLENDILIGRSGNDQLSGEAGNDLLIGGQGSDRLRGGEGFDRFQFRGLGDARDRIVDFSTEDVIVLAAKGFKSAFSEGSLQFNQLHQGSRAQDRTDRLIYHSQTGRLWFDADGTGRTDPIQIAQFTRGTELSYADVLIV